MYMIQLMYRISSNINGGGLFLEMTFGPRKNVIQQCDLNPGPHASDLKMLMEVYKESMMVSG